MVATIGLSQVLFVFTALPFILPHNLSKPFPVPFHLSFTMGGFVFSPGEVLTLIVAPVVALALAAFVRWSPWGLAMRAMSENAGLGPPLGGVGAPHLHHGLDPGRRALGLHRHPGLARADQRPHPAPQPRPPPVRPHRGPGGRHGQPDRRLRLGHRRGRHLRGAGLEHLLDRGRADHHVRPPPWRAAGAGGRPAQGLAHRGAIHVAARLERHVAGRQRPACPGGDRRGRDHRGGGAPPAAGAQRGEDLPALPDLHLRRRRALPHRAHGVGRAGLARPVRAGGGGGGDGGAPRGERPARPVAPLRRRGDRGRGGGRGPPGPAGPGSLPGRLHPRVRAVDAGVGGGHHLLERSAHRQAGLHRPAEPRLDVGRRARPSSG